MNKIMYIVEKPGEPENKFFIHSNVRDAAFSIGHTGEEIDDVWQQLKRIGYGENIMIGDIKVSCIDVDEAYAAAKKHNWEEDFFKLYGAELINKEE